MWVLPHRAPRQTAALLAAHHRGDLRAQLLLRAYVSEAEGDAEALAGGLRRVFEDRGLAEAIARQAFEDAAQYTWDRRAARLERLFEEVVGPVSAGASGAGMT